MGFIVSTLAVLFTAWIVYAATYRAAHLDGHQKGYLEGYRAARADLGRVPAGTRPECTTDPNCPLQQPRAGWTGCPESVKRDHAAHVRLTAAELRAHAAMDDDRHG